MRQGTPEVCRTVPRCGRPAIMHIHETILIATGILKKCDQESPAVFRGSTDDAARNQVQYPTDSTSGTGGSTDARRVRASLPGNATAQEGGALGRSRAYALSGTLQATQRTSCKSDRLVGSLCSV